MQNFETLSDRIDSAFGPLLMAKEIMDTAYLNSDHEASRALATHYVLDLIDMAFREIYPDPREFRPNVTAANDVVGKSRRKTSGRAV